MKKLTMFILLSIMTMASYAQKVHQGQLKTAERYSQMASKAFNLNEDQRAKVLETKKTQFAEMNATVKPMKEAGKNKEEIKKASKAINKIYFDNYLKCFNCTKKELVDFNKKFQVQRKGSN